MARRTLRWMTGVVCGLVMLAGAAPAGALDYATARFEVRTNPYAFGQAPVFVPGNQRVVFGKDLRPGEKNQVYMANYPADRGCAA